jgi:hypothetical protein
VISQFAGRRAAGVRSDRGKLDPADRRLLDGGVALHRRLMHVVGYTRVSPRPMRR